MEYIVAVIIFLMFLYLSDKIEESVERCYESHWMNYEEIHSLGLVEFIYVDYNIHRRYNIHKYTVGLNIRLNINLLDRGIWVKTMDGNTYRMSLTISPKEDKWVIQNIDIETKPLKDNLYVVRLPRYTQNKAP